MALAAQDFANSREPATGLTRRFVVMGKSPRTGSKGRPRPRRCLKNRTRHLPHQPLGTPRSAIERVDDLDLHPASRGGCLH